MRNVLIFLLYYLLLTLTAPLRAADNELTFARDMLEDAIIRSDVEGIRISRERLLRIAADADDPTVERDAHYLIALSVFFESAGGVRDLATLQRNVLLGIRHADRAVQLDPKFADGWMMAHALRSSARRLGQAVPADPLGTPNRMAHAAELDPKAPAVAFLNAAVRSMNPAGAAPPEGVQAFDQLAAQLDADRAATGRPFGLWDANAHLWTIMVRWAQDAPHAEVLRPMIARLLEQRPDFALGRQMAQNLSDHRFVTAPAVTWQPYLTDAAGDGKDPKLPDVLSVDRAEDGDRLWYRVTFHDPLPRSFGVNLVFDRDGDQTNGMPWWGKGTTFRFDRLVTAYITHDGDHYFGTVGVTDEDGVRGFRMIKIPADISIALAPDERSVMLGVPRAAIGLTDAGTMIAAGGSHLVWNDDAASKANSR